MRPIKYIELGYAEIFIFQDYLINQIKDGVTVSMEHVHVLRDIIEENFGDRDLVYISNRVGSYSVDPLVYPQVTLIDNLLGMAIITDNVLHEKSVQFEQLFYKRELKVFKTFEDSIAWAAGLVRKAKEAARLE
ncbi:hypothetical protein [Nonlabens agnitus]|uniref:STAS/SEC14 domain-containing protein n=1 Tax=Nonlabens agnitus TaxID=870484 RepID=A0A2S9WXX3_9FLAO|nr:hypothetical protein [Nonlabens agnitus]PRP68236.1 hypothetical protein BST86_00365 [Nonlabens agnitus]